MQRHFLRPMKQTTCPNIPILKAKILANLVTLECGKNKPTKKHREEAERKMKELVQ